MYEKLIPYKDFKGNVRNETVQFNLTEPEVFKLLGEFQAIQKWIDSMEGQDLKSIDPAEVIEYYTNFENILLTSWGVLSEDGRYFRKAGRYDFEESALFAAVMNMFVSDPEETQKCIAGILPSGLEEIVKKADEKLIALGKAGDSPEMAAEVAALRKKLADLEES